jgi:protoporphyrinogen oxidase/nucleoside-diphosphate-sugar epimerase
LKKVIVTGGAGFLGSTLSETLLKEGYHVTCIDDFSSGRLSNIASLTGQKNFKFINHDIIHPLPDIEVDYIFNFACPASPKWYQSDPIRTAKTAGIGTLNALELARSKGAQFLQASTSEVYGDPEIHPQTEDYTGNVSTIGPRACYDEGKRFAESLCFDFRRMYGLEVKIVRIFNTYGPRMRADDGRVVSDFVVQSLLGKPITIQGDGSQTRSFCFVSDLIKAIIAVNNTDAGITGPFNIGNPQEVSILELAALVQKAVGAPDNIIFLGKAEGDPRRRKPDISLVNKATGWKPEIPLSEGLISTIAYFRESLMEEQAPRTAIIGGGPAGLTAAYELKKLKPEAVVTVFEASPYFGGISRTESYKGFRFDIGGHRFFTKVPEVEKMWREILGADFLRRPRRSRIFYRNNYYDYPLKLFNALRTIGIYESFRIVLSYMKWKIFPSKKEDSFEEWVINRFGGRLYMHFFASYTKKVWGISPREIQADWAVQRIKSLSLFKAVLTALTGKNSTVSLIEEFDYPRKGPGMMWDMTAEHIRAMGGIIETNARVVGLYRKGNRIDSVMVETQEGRKNIAVDSVINSMDLSTLIAMITPEPPKEVVESAKMLRFRDFILVALVLNKPDPFPDNWIYIHSSDVQVGRIQNFRAWSRDMVPNEEQASIGMEYFCQTDDELWNSSDSDLVALATKELVLLGLAAKEDVVDGTVVRQPKAYPMYDGNYRAGLDTIVAWLNTLENFQTIGRNGQHRYNNQDHSMLTGMLAARNLLGEQHDLWTVNVDRAYHEQIERVPEALREKSVTTQPSA